MTFDMSSGSCSLAGPRRYRFAPHRPFGQGDLDACGRADSLLLRQGTHPVVLRVVLDLGEPERLQHGRHVHAEATA